MTREEKEAVLHCLRAMIDEELCEECPLYGTTGTDHCEKDCVRLAIEALERQPSISEDGTLTVNVEDGSNVSRVLVCGDNHFGGLYYPEQEPCDKCVYSTSEGCQYDDITETIPPFETSDDAIRRQAVLDAINTDFHEDLSQLEDVIKALPVVEPKQKTGHWIGDGGNYICSCCRYDPEYFLEPLGLDGGSYMDIPMKYCPQCGAKMTEGSDKE